MIDQIGIALFGVTAVGLSQSKSERLRRWACVFGLLAQPAWFWATWHAQQWGMFALCWLYATMWGMGFWNSWLEPWRKARYRSRFQPSPDSPTRPRRLYEERHHGSRHANNKPYRASPQDDSVESKHP